MTEDLDALANTVRLGFQGCDAIVERAALDALTARAKQAEANERHMRNLHDWRVKDLEKAQAEVERMAMDMYENAVPKDEANRVIAENQEQIRAWGREFLERAEKAEAEVERLTEALRDLNEFAERMPGYSRHPLTARAREALAGKETTT